MIAARARAGPVAGVLCSLAMAIVLVPIAMLETWAKLPVRPALGDEAKVTIRRSDGLVPRGAAPAAVIVARGERVDGEAAAALAVHPAPDAPFAARAAGLGFAFFVIGVMLAALLRTTPRGRLLRVQVALAGLVVGFAAVVKAGLLLTSLPILLAPTAAGALLAAVILDRRAGAAVAAALAAVTAAVVPPFDAGVAVVLATQGMVAMVPLGRSRRKRSFALAGTVAGLAAAAAYLILVELHADALPPGDLADPLRSSLLASAAAGILSAAVALALRAPIEWLAGDVPAPRLVELADLENPLLKQIAAEAPGTWQHSLAMANLAEICANAIGANALLVRVGAYYHDLGKALQPQYYIENLSAGQTSPHDDLPPETSADAIFAHVTEGVRLARAHGLPQAIIDFMHMHHGDGLLEYFWGKCLEQGNPRRLDERHFRYPGVKPQSRETAILAICDAVEAASRTLQKPDARAIETLVQRIVFGKMYSGQLDESHISVGDLRRMARTLVETLKHAHHVRIEYPWQKEERARARAQMVTPTSPMQFPAGSLTTGTTGAFVLDSGNGPRPPALIVPDGNGNGHPLAVDPDGPTQDQGPIVRK